MMKKFFVKALTALALAAVLGGAAALPAHAAGYYAQNGKIYDPSGQRLQIRGINHFGFNADVLAPQYLWQMGWKEQIAQIKSLGFNAVRVPITPDTLYVQTPVNQLGYIDPGKNPELIGKTSLQALDLWMAEADRQGLYVMLDMHSVTHKRQYMTWFTDSAADASLIYNAQPYTEDHWLRDLKFIAQRYAHIPHFFAIDVYNEPNGPVRWSVGDPNATNPKYHWKAATEKAAAAILGVNPKLMIFVQGITANWDGVENSSIPMNWAENFQPQRYQPLNIPSDKLVLSPHTYGPDVYVKSTFSASTFPANLAAGWETLFGQFYPTHPVIPGEWGGRYGQGGDPRDVAWQNAFVDYMLAKGMSDSFYWCYSPNSGDTGGILDDSLNVRQDKMLLLQRLWGSVASASSLSLSSSSYAAAQSSGMVSVSVKRVGGTGAVSVQYATANGTAIAGSDYSARSGTLNWAAGDTAPRTVSIPVSTATPFSGTRSLTLTLSNASTGAVLGTPSTASITINGAAVSTPGILGLSASSYSVAQVLGSLTVTVARSGGSSGAVSVQYATADGTALAGADYTGASGTLSWLAGDTAVKTITLKVNTLALLTGSKSFSLRLSNPGGGATLATTSSATVTITGILGGTTAGNFALSASSYSVSQTAGTVSIVVRRAAGSAGAVSVRYSTANGTAVAGADYTARSGTLNWAAGDMTTRTVKIAISNAVLFTGSKRFTLALGATTGGAVLGTPSSAIVTINGSGSSTVTYPQPYIQSFTPASGPVGTVVTISGSGFTGLSRVTVGSAVASYTVVSDTQLRVTVPAGALTSQIALFNPKHAAWTPAAFTVTQ